MAESFALPFAPAGVLAIVCVGENCRNNFFSPDFVTRTHGAFSEVLVSFEKITINGRHAFFGALVVAVMDNCSGHPAKN
ncbi:MAG: hypothetical protein ACKOF3_10005 [Spartobacteria bacterium]